MTRRVGIAAVSTVEELGALPEGAVIITHRDVVYQKQGNGWSKLDALARFEPNYGWIPATVLYVPVSKENQE